MLSVIIFLFCISALPVFFSCVVNKKFEEALPFSFFTGILIIYCTGLISNLQAGVVVWLAVCCLLYIASIFAIIRFKSIKACIENIFTVPFYLFAFLALILAVLNIGRIPVGWDEFSHWGITVKAMLNVNDFSANILANTGFGSYPPSMGLLQYAIQIFERFFGGDFSDWKMYYVYQLFSFSLFLPFLKKSNKRTALPCFIAFFFAAIIFDINLLGSLYIDSFVAILSASLLAYTSIYEDDLLGLCTLSAGLFTLLMAKNVGMFFAVIIYAAFFIMHIRQYRLLPQKNKLKFSITAVSPLVMILFAKLSWKLVLIFHDTPIKFKQTLGLGELFKILTGKSESSKTEVLRNFINKFFSEQILNLGIVKVTYFQGLVLLICVACFIYWLNKKCEKKMLFLSAQLLTASIGLILYSLSLPIVYITKFVDTEAVALASFERYLGIAYSFILTFLLIILAIIAINNVFAKRYLYIAVLSLFLIAPANSVSGYIFRTTMHEQYNWIRPQIETVQTMKAIIPESEISSAGYISLYSSAYEGSVVRYYTFPIPLKCINTNFESELNAEELNEKYNQEISKYSYVATFTLDDFFKENCSSLFENPAELREYAVYRVSESTGLLQLIQ